MECYTFCFVKDIFGYKSSRCRSVLFVIGSILTCGFLLLLFYWRPEWDVWSKCIQCTLQEADIVLLRTTDEFKIWTKKKVMWVQLSFPSSTARADQQHSLFSDETSLLHRIVIKPDLKVRFIEIQKIRYIWDLYEKQFIRAERLIFGPNVIDIRISPIWKLLCKEVLNPFYTFQIFSVCLWLSEDYTEYSVALIIMSFISIAFSVYDVRQQSIKLYRLVETHNNMMVTICRKGGGYEKVPSSELVPGDVFIVTGNKQVLSCDAILIHGGCIVNESMLTGESIPVTKTPLPSTVSCSSWKSSTEDYKRHILFCGTQVIQSKATSEGEVRAVVYRTGFTTTKGELVRSILYPKPIDFKLYQDAFRFLLCLAAIATIGMIYSVCILVLNGIPPGKVVRKALDVITIAVSPALPASVTIGIIYAQERLKKKGIYCINPQRINMCGQLNLICFDKTGTLTEDGLDLWGLVSTKGKGLQNIFKFNNGDTLPWGPLFGAMVSCHSLILLDNTLQGDPLDLKMFEITRWELKENTMLKLQNEETHSFIVKPGPKANKFHERFQLNCSVTQSKALKIAHAGISLSEQEASVASPFTSKIPNIDCVPQLIKEGRAALVSSFCIFKYMALYSMIQYVGVLCLYWQANTFGNYQFLFEDLAIATVIGITMSFNHAYPQLDPNQPPGQLISPPLLLSVILNVILSLVLHVFGFIMVQQQPWYTPTDIYRACNPTNLTSDGKTTSNKTTDTIAIALRNEDSYKSYENTTVYLLSLFNCISTAIVFSKGKPYRKPIYTNYIFMIVLLAQFGTCLYFLFGKHETLYNALDLVCTPRSWRVYLLVMVLVHFTVIMAIEEILIENRCLKVFLTKCCKVKSTQRYKKMQRIITKEPNWPPEDDTDYTTSCTMDEAALEAYSNMNYEHDKDSKTASNGFANTTSKQIEEGSSKKDNI
ncbi:hypothetical protein chiPu_0001181 [Chiloscyllium punctatum]|uniref:Cation-transporting ATPase n=1 Tax=Chiloscyllium punctatum TaxID=137246 RepID=A0A401RXB3_CHIPU|nr:hypothetical protein [Chiloscyllium punctatum]